MKCSYLGILLLLIIKLNAQDAFVAYGMYPKKSGDVRLFANYYRYNVQPSERQYQKHGQICFPEAFVIS